MATTTPIDPGPMSAPYDELEAPPDGFLRRRWKLLLAVGIPAAGLVLWLAFGYFGVHTLFIDDKAVSFGKGLNGLSWYDVASVYGEPGQP